MRYRLLLVLFQALPAVLVKAQLPYYARYQQFTEKDGYSVYESPALMSQDREGRIWIGGDNGLMCFDGLHFRSYRHDPQDSLSPPANTISYNFQDRFGGYWVAVPKKGLYRFDPATRSFRLLQYANQKSFNIHQYDVQYPAETSNGDIWFPVLGFGLAQWSRKESRMIPHPLCATGNCGSFYSASWAICVQPDPDDETLWVGTNHGLVHYFPRTRRADIFFNPPRPVNDVYIRLFFDAERTLWVGSWGGGLERFDRKTKRFTSFRWNPGQGGTVNICSGIGAQDADHLWVTTVDNGLLLFDKKKRSFRQIRGMEGAPTSLNAVSSWVNSHGVIWTAGMHALTRVDLSENPFSYFSLDSLLQQRPISHGVYSFARYRDDVYAGICYSGFLVRCHLPTGRAEVVAKDRIMTIFSIVQDRDSLIWIGSGSGVHILDPRTGMIRQPPPPVAQAGLFRLRTHVILHARDGTVWLANEKGLAHYIPRSKTVEWIDSAQFQTALYRINSLVEDRAGRIWYGTITGGLRCYLPSQKRIVLLDSIGGKPFPRITVDGVLEAPNGDMLFTAGNAGVVRIVHPLQNGERLEYLNSTTGYPFDKVLNLFRDRKNRIWFYSTNGLVCRNEETGELQQFGRPSGMFDKVVYGFPYQDAEGRIYLGFHNCFQTFDPDGLLQTKKVEGRLVLSDFFVNGKERLLQGSEKLVLDPDQSSLSFAFTFLNADQSTGYRYQYLLQGLENKWHDAGLDGRGQYNGLPPGSYELRVRVRDARGRDLDVAYSLPIRIRPPWFETWWFYGLLASFAVLALFLIFRYRLNSVRKENQLKHQFQRKIGEIEMRALRAQMNPHFIFNCLNSINRYIVKSDHKTASGYLTKFAKLIRLILDNSASDTVSLDREIQTLQLYIEMERLRFDHAFDYEIDATEVNAPETVFLPSLLLQPYVENAIWHGLLHKENGRGFLWLRFRQQTPGLLVVTIEDNGVGREKAGEMRGRETLRRSYGMQISRERIQLINELYGMEASVQVRDLREGGRASGTSVVVQIPLKND